jgi:hypothetical protein
VCTSSGLRSATKTAGEWSPTFFLCKGPKVNALQNACGRHNEEAIGQLRSNLRKPNGAIVGALIFMAQFHKTQIAQQNN